MSESHHFFHLWIKKGNVVTCSKFCGYCLKAIAADAKNNGEIEAGQCRGAMRRPGIHVAITVDVQASNQRGAANKRALPLRDPWRPPTPSGCVFSIDMESLLQLEECLVPEDFSHLSAVDQVDAVVFNGLQDLPIKGPAADQQVVLSQLRQKFLREIPEVQELYPNLWFIFYPGES